MNRIITTAKGLNFNKKKQWVRLLLEILAAFFIALLVEVAFNYQSFINGYEPVAITNNITDSKGKLIFTKTMDQPVYIKKLILQGKADQMSYYRIDMVTVNDFGKEETVELKDAMLSELDTAFTNINENVKEIKITFKYPSNVHLTSISYSNQADFNKFRIAFFWLVGFLVILILFEKKLLLNRLWLFYTIAAVGFGSIIVVTSGAYAITWDEEIHYMTVHNTGFSSVVSSNSAASLNFARNIWENANTVEERYLLNQYLNKEAKKDHTTYEYPKVIRNYITHFPMILAYHFGEKIGLSYTDNYMLGRFGNLIFSVLLNALAIILARRKKILIAVVGMMPTVIFQSSMYTYDGVCFSCITLGAVLCINELEKSRGTEKVGNIIAAAALLCIGSVVKPVYSPVILLLIPCIWGTIKPFFNTKIRKRIGICAIIVLAVLAMGAVTMKLRPLADSIAQGDLTYGGDIRGGDTGMAGQLLSIMEHPVAFGKMLIRDIFSFDNFRNARDEVENTTLICNQMFLNMYILGTLKEVWALLLLPLLLLVFLVEPQGEPKAEYSQKRIRIDCSLVIILSVILVWLAMYLTFTPIGDASIQGVQARYFLPLFFPFACMVCSNNISLKISRLHYYQLALGGSLVLCAECIYKFLIVGKTL